jgi:UDP-N-acetylglucosamine transferase subunit ALG13
MLGAGAVIFASVGSMLPFDRFVRGVDEWAAANPDEEVFLQIGNGAYEPEHAPWARIVPHSEYRQRLADCALFVAHVGMGSILQALEARKQMVLLPRHASLGEHTTEHQLHTAGKFRDTPGLLIVDDVADLHLAMSRLVAEPMAASSGIPQFAPDTMTTRIAGFLRG